VGAAVEILRGMPRAALQVILRFLARFFGVTPEEISVGLAARSQDESPLYYAVRGILWLLLGFFLVFAGLTLAVLGLSDSVVRGVTGLHGRPGALIMVPGVLGIILATSYGQRLRNWNRRRGIAIHQSTHGIQEAANYTSPGHVRRFWSPQRKLALLMLVAVVLADLSRCALH
jgi:hypothetical protein